MTEPKVCVACGHRNDPSANFCSSCGERIGSTPDEPTASIPIVEHPEQVDHDHLEDRNQFDAQLGLLVVDNGPKGGSRYALDTEIVTAGRHPESDIFLDDVTVSRRHVEILSQDGVYRARDVGSLNGTYVNRQLIEETILVDGDELQIGRFKLRFFHGTGAAAQMDGGTP